MSDTRIDTSIVTPVRSPGFFGELLQGPTVLGWLARLAARLVRKPVRLAGRVIAASHADVRELLARDLEFGIAAVNARKIEEVNGGAFILGMDRSAAHERERRALYAALAEVDLDPIRAAVEADIVGRLAAADSTRPFDTVGAFARPIAARTAQRLFGVTGPDDVTFMEVARSIFGHTFLNLSDDAKAQRRGIDAGRLMQRWLSDEIARRRAAGESGSDLMGALIHQGELDDDGIRRTLGGMLVGSVDTTATCVAKILTVLGREPQLQHRMRRDLGDVDRLYGWCLDALRLWPHNPLVMREASRATALGGLEIKAGERVIAFSQAAMNDASVFDAPRQLRPDRDRSAYLHFGGGLHPCAGRAVNRFQIPMLVGGLVARGIAAIGQVRWAGPFPHRLDVTLARGTG